MMKPDAQPVVRFVVLIESGSLELVSRATHRFKLEFGIADPVPLDLPGAGSMVRRWLALDYRARPDRLPSAQEHAIRLEALHEGSDLRITFGYVDRFRTVRAERSDAPGRLYLARGVWASVPLLRNEQGRLQPAGDSDPVWHDPRSLAFLNAIDFE